ncbi:MAG: arginyltransferase, partial [Pseudomonadota bacterium]|nr:arginyltransferase [Pseudomonadota bacterium]
MTSQPRDAPQFYLTSPSACPYLPGKEERKVFTHIVGRRGRELNEILTQGGFRRSQTIAYRPACDTCRACVSVRVLVNEFEPSGNLRRVLKDNGDLIGNANPNRPTSEQYSLFRRYVDTRHADGGMADMSVLDYSMMVEDSHVDTKLIEYRRRGIDSGITGRGEGGLIAACLT